MMCLVFCIGIFVIGLSAPIILGALGAFVRFFFLRITTFVIGGEPMALGVLLQKKNAPIATFALKMMGAERSMAIRMQKTKHIMLRCACYIDGMSANMLAI